ncbi:1-deoxy-D-xylulose 5-phosphate reductoisomerase [bacterium HR19]|nr:1-deoxy-D-xylulose 5-phosphate reductoisomerase [bacterium HR19]
MKNKEKKRIALIGSTGSIGTQCLQVVDSLPEKFEIIGITAMTNFKLLAKQIIKYKPKYVCIAPEKRAELERELKESSFKANFEYAEIADIVRREEIDLVVVGVPGFASCEPVFNAVQAGKEIAVASKEAILCLGKLLFEEAEKKKAKILPVDSEHSSLWKLIDSYPRENIKKVYITASGGPFWKHDKSKIENAPYEEVIKHPVWNMGVKITVDSALLINKAFEIIEASYLFSIPAEKIGVKIHPEAIVHSAIELKDGTFIMSAHFPDMRIPIMYAMLYPYVEDIPFEIPSIWEKPLNFFEPDFERFPSLLLGWRCAKLKEPFPCILVSADEVAVEYFISRKIRFWDIYTIVEKTVSYFEKNRDELPSPMMSIEDVKKIYEISKKKAKEIADSITKKT